MKKFFLLTIATFAAFVAVACNQSPQGGNPGTNDSFRVQAPTMTTSVKQGDRQTVNLKVDRGSEFRKNIKLEAEAPKGLKVELSNTNVKPNDTATVALTIEAEKDAALASHTIKVTATPETGAATTVEVPVKIDGHNK